MADTGHACRQHIECAKPWRAQGAGGDLRDVDIVAGKLSAEAGFREVVPTAGALAHKGALHVRRPALLQLHVAVPQPRPLQPPAPALRRHHHLSRTSVRPRCALAVPRVRARTPSCRQQICVRRDTQAALRGPGGQWDERRQRRGQGRWQHLGKVGLQHGVGERGTGGEGRAEILHHLRRGVRPQSHHQPWGAARHPPVPPACATRPFLAEQGAQTPGGGARECWFQLPIQVRQEPRESHRVPKSAMSAQQGRAAAHRWTDTPHARGGPAARPPPQQCTPHHVRWRR